MSEHSSNIPSNALIGTTGLSTAANNEEKKARLVSLDQLRGFTVASMFVVNFSGSLKAMPAIIKHQHGYESLADWIMPTFMFLVGFSFRLSWLGVCKHEGTHRAVSKFLKRGMVLALISLFLYAGENGIRFGEWLQLSQESITKLLATTFKANLWETLAIIGGSQILILPLIGLPSKVRFIALLGLMLGYTLLCYWFNWDFVHGRPNVLDDFLGTTGTTAWDGGVVGLMSWASLMLAGSLVHDYLIRQERISGTILRLIVVGILVGTLAWGISGLSRLYDVPAGEQAGAHSDNLAESPVLPDFSAAAGRSWSDLLAEPPLVSPPGPDKRKINYWMMYKKMVSLPFVLFNIGVGITLLGIFMLLCEVRKHRSEMLNRFGQNALAAYCIHHFLVKFHLLFVPKDSPAWWCWLNLLMFMFVIDRCLAWMQKKQLRLSV